MFRASTAVPSDLPRPTVVPSDPDGLRARFVSWRRWLNGPGQRTGLIVFFALVISVWHLFEHSLLLGQALTGHDLFGASVPTSVLQVFMPRVELHLAYNGVVLVAMLMALAYLRAQATRQGLGG